MPSHGDVLAAQLGAEDLVGQDHDLELDVVALEVGGGVGFGVSQCLGFRDGGRQVESFFESAEDVVRGAVHDALDAGDLQSAEQALGGAQDGGAAEHRALELEADTVFGGQRLECPAGEGDRSLVGGAHVLAGFEGPAHVGEGGLAVGGVRVRRFDHDVRWHVADHPLIAWIGTSAGQASEAQRIGFRGQQRHEVDAVGVDQGTGPQVRDCHDAQSEPKLISQVVAALSHELGQRAVDTAEADEGEVVSVHVILLGSAPQPSRWVC